MAICVFSRVKGLKVDRIVPADGWPSLVRLVAELKLALRSVRHSTKGGGCLSMIVAESGGTLLKIATLFVAASQ